MMDFKTKVLLIAILMTLTFVFAGIGFLKLLADKIARKKRNHVS